MSHWLSWASEKDFENHEGWFLNYLGRNGLIPPGYGGQRYLKAQERIHYLSGHLNKMHQHEPHRIELTIKRMKGAWAQKIRRMKSPHDKTYNFFMSKQVQSHLRQIAKVNDTSINKALELLILDESKFIHDLKHAHQQEIKRLKENFESRRPKQLTSVERLHALHKQASSTSGKESEPQASITMTKEELRELISEEVTHRVNEIIAAREEQSDTASMDQNQGKVIPEPPTTTPDSAPVIQAEPDEPLTTLGIAFQKAAEKSKREQ